MPTFNTPINTNDQSFDRVLAQPQPLLVTLYERELPAHVEQALKEAARDYKGEMLVVRVDVSDNPDTRRKYEGLSTPAIITLPSDRNIKSKAERVSADDVRLHVEHLLYDRPLPESPNYSYSGNTNNNPSTTQANHPLNVTDASFQKEVLESDVPVLVDFWADWCMPCKMIAPHVDRLAKQYVGRLKVVKMDTQYNRMIPSQYGISAIPTFIMFKNGQMVNRMSGADLAGIQRMVEAVLR